MSAPFLGIEIGGTKLQLVLGDARGRIEQRFRFTVAAAEGGAAIRRQIEATVRRVGQAGSLRGIGVGFGGPVDWRTGRVCCSHQVEGWADFELGAWLRTLAAVPVRVDNDANVAALGEARLGAGVGCNPVFYMTMGSGVGGGLVVDGQVYHGARPGEAEIGHVRLDRAGTALETRCSGWAVDRKIRDLIGREPGGLLARLVGTAAGGEARHLSEALRERDAEAEAILRETAGELAYGLSHVVHLFHPEVILLGGGLSLVGEALRRAVAEALPVLVMEAFAPGPRVELAQLGEDAVTAGALVLASQGGPG